MKECNFSVEEKDRPTETEPLVEKAVFLFGTCDGEGILC